MMRADVLRAALVVAVLGVALAGVRVKLADPTWGTYQPSPSPAEQCWDAHRVWVATARACVPANAFWPAHEPATASPDYRPYLAPADYSAIPPVTAACGKPAGARVSTVAALELASRYDWAPYSPQTMVRVFGRESERYMGIVSCSGDYGWTQINGVHRGWCELGRVVHDPAYATWCAHEIYRQQGIEAFHAAKGWLY